MRGGGRERGGGCGWGHKNINTANEMIPALINVTRDLTKDEIKDIILSGKRVEKLDPSGPDPLASPASRGDMTEQEADYIYDYLLSIAPKKKKFRFGVSP